MLYALRSLPPLSQNGREGLMGFLKQAGELRAEGLYRQQEM
jgi:hypothetical protein